MLSDGVKLKLSDQLQSEFPSLQDAGESFYRQKAWVNWIGVGDQGTKFFHNAIAVKRNMYSIRALFDDRGNKLESHEQIASKIIQFDKGLIGVADQLLRDILPTLSMAA